MLKINSGKVILNGVDITDRPMINYVACAGKKGFVILKPSLYENRSEGTFITREQDDDRIRYIPYWKGEDVGYCNSRKEAENILAEYEQRQYEMENAKDCGAFDILDGLE